MPLTNEYVIGMGVYNDYPYALTIYHKTLKKVVYQDHSLEFLTVIDGEQGIFLSRSNNYHERGVYYEKYCIRKGHIFKITETFVPFHPEFNAEHFNSIIPLPGGSFFILNQESNSYSSNYKGWTVDILKPESFEVKRALTFDRNQFIYVNRCVLLPDKQTVLAWDDTTRISLYNKEKYQQICLINTNDFSVQLVNLPIDAGKISGTISNVTVEGDKTLIKITPSQHYASPRYFSFTCWPTANSQTKLQSFQAAYDAFLKNLPQKYADGILEDGAWGGEPELHLIAKALHVKIKVYEQGKESALLFGADDTEDTIKIIYNGINHYQLFLYKINQHCFEGSEGISDGNCLYDACIRAKKALLHPSHHPSHPFYRIPPVSESELITHLREEVSKLFLADKDVIENVQMLYQSVIFGDESQQSLIPGGDLKEKAIELKNLYHSLSEEEKKQFTGIEKRNKLGSTRKKIFIDSKLPADCDRFSIDGMPKKLLENRKTKKYGFKVEGDISYYRYYIVSKEVISVEDLQKIEVVLASFPHASKSRASIEKFLEFSLNEIPKHILSIAANAFDSHGNTMLGVACEYGYSVEAVQKLMDMGANLNTIDCDSKLPLHWAIKNKNSYHAKDSREAAGVVECLLKNGAKTDIVCYPTLTQTQTLLQYAESRGYTAAARLIKEYSNYSNPLKISMSRNLTAGSSKVKRSMDPVVKPREFDSELPSHCHSIHRFFSDAMGMDVSGEHLTDESMAQFYSSIRERNLV